MRRQLCYALLRLLALVVLAYEVEREAAKDDGCEDAKGDAQRHVRGRACGCEATAELAVDADAELDEVGFVGDIVACQT